MATFDPIHRIWNNPDTYSLKAIAGNNTSITNQTWKFAAQAGNIDLALISKQKRAGVVRAQFNLCDPLFGVEFGLTEEEGGGYSELQRRKKILGEICNDFDKVLQKFLNWRSASDEEKAILETAVRKGDEFQNDLNVAKRKYSLLAIKTPRSKSAAKEKLFEVWVWYLATAFYEAGGLVTMTAPGASEQENYTGAFYFFSLRFMLDEPNWPLSNNPKAFGAKLYRALQNLRSPKIGKDGQSFVIIAKGKVLRTPT